MTKVEQFIKDHTRNYSNEKRITIGKVSKWEKQPWLTPDHARAVAEIAREEVIEKAVKWLREHWREYTWLTDGNVIHLGLWENDFRKALEKD